MSGTVDNWPALSFLEGLRPGPDENVELALVASYSADLGSIGATLLALAGNDTDAGRGSPSDFADAVERLRGKVRIIVQRGRLAKMRRTPRIAAVLDQFVREVDFDEATHSWHPKVALVRTRDADGKAGWRLWIGSRNLTENVNRDIGLLLLSGEKNGTSIPGAEEVARALAERAALKGVRPDSLGIAVAKVTWRAPAGVRVERLRWSTGSGDMAVPVPPVGTDEVVVVSPFIDKTFLAQQAPQGSTPTRGVLLTTMREIERIGPSLSAFDDLLALDAPDYPVDDPERDAEIAVMPSDLDRAYDEEEELGRGLHAKLLFMRSGQKRRLWLGSANATMRAWTGRNVEITAELVVSEPVERGLKALLGSARLVRAPVAEHTPDAAALEEEALERARAQVAARWGAQLVFDDKGARLAHRSDLYPDGPHPDERDIALEVGALYSELVAWPCGQTIVPLGPIAPAERSEFVRLRVTRGEKGLSWLQRAPADPPLGEDRDRAAFVRFLGARGFLLWLAGLLADDGREGEGDWTNDEPRGRADPGLNSALDSSLPTLEEMLAAWARDPEKFREVERRVSQYLPAVLEEARQEDLQTKDMLRRFDDLWGKLRSGARRCRKQRQASMSTPKPFQKASVDAASAAYDDLGGRRRFLVADEVGLGKTVVAKELACRMADDGRRPLTIYYIANGHAVSHQNKSRVVGFLGDSQLKDAIKTPDRLSLIAVEKRPTTPVLIYALTPATSFPGAKARLTGGRKEERAFLKVLLEQSYPAFVRDLDLDILRLNARGSWGWAVTEAEKKFELSPPGLRQRFRDALEVEFGEPVRAMLDLALHGDTERKIKPLRPTTFVGRLRRALALATLRHQPPDLVILDEFQRYRQLLDEKDADPLLKALLEPQGAARPPAILLLSATPYPYLSTRWEESRGALAHAELLKLIEFLAGPDVRDRARGLFSDFGDKLRAIAAYSDASRPELMEDVAEARRLRGELRQLMTPFMSRTERDSVASPDPLAGTRFLHADPLPEDFRVYRHLAESFTKQMRYEALPYWSSVPLPAQSLGPRYAAWKKARIKAAPKLTRMTRERRNKLDAPADWPDAKLRALNSVAPPESLSLPWVAPSLAWWPLRGSWAAAKADPNADAGPKLLMFSRFRATPPSVAALLSFGVEAHCLPKKEGGYEKAYRRRRFKLLAVPGPVMTAFHPSPWLIRNTDPLAKLGAPLGDVRKEIRRQILAALPKGILERGTIKARRRHRSIGRVLASIERLAGVAEQSATGWSSAIGDDRAAQSAVRKWRQTPPVDSLSPAELSDLVDYAISAPGVVLGRALRRHDPTILDIARYPELVQLSWQGLRAYLDNPVILSSLPGRNAVEQAMRAVVDGGFESVLDEHFWLRAQNLHEGAAGLAKDLKASLGLRAGSFSFHGIGGQPHKIPVRCHVAVPFGDAEGEPVVTDGGVTQVTPARPDEVRRSFNTPFWPHVLATTSVGQEGLDFHPWCSHVVHWDLSSNPLDLEQREGRIQRYAGLSVRRKLAEDLRDEVLGDPAMGQGSPWRYVERHAERFVDKSGLRPWWVLDGAEIRRHVFERPFGRDMLRFAQLREQRMIYRLALGQPNQEDFVDVLARGGETTRALLQPLVLDFSAMGLRQQQQRVASDLSASGHGQMAESGALALDNVGPMVPVPTTNQPITNVDAHERLMPG